MERRKTQPCPGKLYLFRSAVAWAFLTTFASIELVLGWPWAYVTQPAPWLCCSSPPQPGASPSPGLWGSSLSWSACWSPQKGCPGAAWRALRRGSAQRLTERDFVAEARYLPAATTAVLWTSSVPCCREKLWDCACECGWYWWVKVCS